MGESFANSEYDEFDCYVGKRIRAMRVISGLTQTELANVLGLTFQQVQKYEKGTNKVSCKRLAQLAQYFDCELAYFFPSSVGEEEYAPVETHAIAHPRLKLEIGRALNDISSLTFLRALLQLTRAARVSDVREPVTETSLSERAA